MIRAALLAALLAGCVVDDPLFCESDSDCLTEAGETCNVALYTCVVVEGDAPEAPDGGAECSTHIDCGGNSACHNGTCVPLPRY
jgi:hypothetical protein